MTNESSDPLTMRRAPIIQPEPASEPAGDAPRDADPTPSNPPASGGDVEQVIAQEDPVPKKPEPLTDLELVELQTRTIAELTLLPAKRRDVALVIVGARVKLDEVREAAKRIQAAVMLEVTAETVTEPGDKGALKVKARFSNEQARAAECAERLARNATHAALTMQERDLDQGIREAEVQLRFLDDRITNARELSRLTTAMRSAATLEAKP